MLIIIIIDISTYIFSFSLIFILNLCISSGSSHKVHILPRGGVERERKKFGDQDKAGELNFGFQSLVAIPQVFFIFVSRSMTFFGIFHRIFHFGAKRSLNSLKQNNLPIIEGKTERKIDLAYGSITFI